MSPALNGLPLEPGRLISRLYACGCLDDEEDDLPERHGTTGDDDMSDTLTQQQVDDGRAMTVGDLRKVLAELTPNTNGHSVYVKSRAGWRAYLSTEWTLDELRQGDQWPTTILSLTIADPMAEMPRWKAIADKLAEAVRQAEYVHFDDPQDGSDYHQCPWCGHDQPGHHADCPADAALAEYDKAKTPERA